VIIVQQKSRAVLCLRAFSLLISWLSAVLFSFPVENAGDAENGWLVDCRGTAPCFATHAVPRSYVAQISLLQQ
jgi:hypothetical protein